MEHGWRRYLFLGGVCLGLGLFFYQGWLTMQMWDRAGAALDIRGRYLVYAAACIVAAYALQMLTWMFIMRKLSVPLTILDVVRGYPLSFLPRYIPGSVWGYWGRSHWLARSYATPYRISFLGSIYEAGYLILAAMLIGLGYLGAHLELLVNLRFVPPPFWVVGASSVLLLGAALFWNYGLTLATEDTFAGGAGAWFARARTKPLSQPRNWLTVIVILGLYMLMWALHGWATWFVGSSFKSTQLSGNVWGVVAATAVAWAIGFLVLLVPSGLGVREWSLAFLLRQLGLIPTELALLMATFSRGFLFAAELFWILFSLALGLGYKLQAAPQHSSDEDNSGRN